MSEQPSCPSKELLVTALYGEASPDEQALLQGHLAVCDECRAEFEGLGGVRRALQGWETPQLGSNFRIVSEPAEERPPGHVIAGPARWWARPTVGWASLAAAAVLVMGVSAGLANLDVTVAPDGVRVRTGWNHEQTSASAPLPPAGGVTATAAAGSLPQRAEPAAAEAPWRVELAALEQRLRADMTARPVQSGPALVAANGRADDEAVLSRVQALIDQAETRQQQNLALRMTELARDFDMQRKADFVQIQQGLGRAEAEAARTQQMMNYLVRTASTTPR